MSKKEELFNRIFSVSLMVLMAVVIIGITIKNYADAGGARDKALLVVAAFASVCGIMSTVLSANARIANFFFGIVNVTVYGIVCFMKGNFGNAAINLLYFLPMQFVGLSSWRKRGAGKSRLSARRLDASGRILFPALFLVGSIVAWIILCAVKATPGQSLHDLLWSADPAISAMRRVVAFDAVATVCNLIGQYLLSLAYMEQWFFWIVVNISSVAMWSLTAAGDAEAGRSTSLAAIYIVKYSFYLINALNGLRIWWALSRPADAVDAADVAAAGAVAVAAGVADAAAGTVADAVAGVGIADADAAADAGADTDADADTVAASVADVAAGIAASVADDTDTVASMKK